MNWHLPECQTNMTSKDSLDFSVPTSPRGVTGVPHLNEEFRMHMHPDGEEDLYPAYLANAPSDSGLHHPDVPFEADIYPVLHPGSPLYRLSDAESIVSASEKASGFSNVPPASVPSRPEAALMVNKSQPPPTEEPQVLRSIHDIRWKEITISLSDSEDEEETVVEETKERLTEIIESGELQVDHRRSATWSAGYDEMMASINSQTLPKSGNSSMRQSPDLSDRQKNLRSQDFKLRYQFVKEGEVKEDFIGWLGTKTADSSWALNPGKTSLKHALPNKLAVKNLLTMVVPSCIGFPRSAPTSPTSKKAPRKPSPPISPCSEEQPATKSPPPRSAPKKRPTSKLSGSASPAQTPSGEDKAKPKHRKSVSLGAFDFDFQVESPASDGLETSPASRTAKKPPPGKSPSSGSPAQTLRSQRSLKVGDEKLVKIPRKKSMSLGAADFNFQVGSPLSSTLETSFEEFERSNTVSGAIVPRATNGNLQNNFGRSRDDLLPLPPPPRLWRSGVSRPTHPEAEGDTREALQCKDQATGVESAGSIQPAGEEGDEAPFWPMPRIGSLKLAGEEVVEVPSYHRPGARPKSASLRLTRDKVEAARFFWGK